MSYEEIIADYSKNPEKYYGMLKGIDEEEFDYFNQLLPTPVDKQDFISGNTCIIQYAGFEIPEEYIKDKKVSFMFQNELYEISIGAVSHETYYSGTNIGATLIVSQNYLRKLASRPYTLSLNIRYNESYDEDVENQILALLENSPYSNDLLPESKYENMRTIQESQGNMMEIGTIIALLLLFVGVLNYVNTMASGIQNRRLTFSVMESIGMSGKQIERLLIREGLLYAFSPYLLH